MMIPEIINETERTECEDGSITKQYIVYAPQWEIYLRNPPQYTIIKVDRFVISETNLRGDPLTLVYPADDQGKLASYRVIIRQTGYKAEQVLVSFGLLMSEAGYDPI